MIKILVVSNELDTLSALNGNHPRSGHRVVNVGDEQTALTVLKHERPDLVVLDLALPGNIGVQVCRQLRRSTDVPILVLSDSMEEAERAVAQDGCADDFVLKPFSPRQVVVRIQTLLRWAERRGTSRPDVIRTGSLEIFPANQQTVVSERSVDLTRAEPAVLTALAVEPGRVCPRAQLAIAISGGRTITERTVDTRIKNLRAKIEPDRQHPQYILTVYGVGYKLNVAQGVH
jgi:DNA-binding response OmpR family regulator